MILSTWYVLMGQIQTDRLVARDWGGTGGDGGVGGEICLWSHGNVAKLVAMVGVRL